MDADSAKPANADDITPPFLAMDPPHWAARGLAYVLILLFATVAVVSALIHLPEVVSCPFVLLPIHGVDPIRAPGSGVVADVRVAEGQSVRKGDRTFVIQSQIAGDDGADLSVPAPCSGTLLRLHVKAPGAVVGDGDVLYELACSGEHLQAELIVPQSGIGRIEAGQRVKLLYDAFPYQRYGVRYGTLRWISPASVLVNDTPVFRALADIEDEAIVSEGQARPLVAGMAGRARVIVGRRSLIAYAFEPLRQLKESLANAPKEGVSRKMDPGPEHGDQP